MIRAVLLFWVVLAASASISCQRETREDSRQTRLDTFRAVLPLELRDAFDAIESREDCEEVSDMLTAAREWDLTLSLAVDSIIHAELIDTFSDEEVVYFFWFYFAHAIETGTVRGP